MFRTDICRALADSVWEEISNAMQSVQTMNLEGASRELEIVAEIVTEKTNAFSDDYHDDVFNDGFVLKQFINLLNDYVYFWKLLVSNKFSNSWSALQDVQDRLRTIYRSTSEPRPQILSHIEGQCGELEKLYPYQVFASVGMVEKEAECSICGKSIDSFECQHIRGELYRGRQAYGIVKQIKQLEEVSLVTNPADKRCTIQLLDTSEQFSGVKSLAKGIRDKVLAPLDFSHLEFKRIRKPNNEITVVGRNDLCPCGSGKKFKKCCIDKSYIETTHVEIVPKIINVANLVQLSSQAIQAKPLIVLVR
jgi:hypothetical protein